MFFDTSTQLKTWSMPRKRGTSPKRRFMSMSATAGVGSRRAMLSARLTAIVVVPTPPFPPKMLMIWPFRCGPDAAGDGVAAPSRILERAARTSASLTGWEKNSFTPIRRAWMRTSGLAFFDVRKNSRAPPAAFVRPRYSKSCAGSSPISRIRMSGGSGSSPRWTRNPSIEEITVAI